MYQPGEKIKSFCWPKKKKKKITQKVKDNKSGKNTTYIKKTNKSIKDLQKQRIHPKWNTNGLKEKMA